MPRPYGKLFSTIDEQIATYRARGMAMADEAQARRVLQEAGYYRLSAYTFPFKAAGPVEQFQPGTSFEHVYRHYEFDRGLRSLLFDALELLEVFFRSNINYILAERYGPFGHCTASNFSARFSHMDWLAEVRDEAAGSRDRFVEHYRNNYQEFPDLPIWVLSELISFGCLSRLYQGMRNADQEVLAAKLGLKSPVVVSWLRAFCGLRNICAHHSRLWNRVLGVPPMRPHSVPWPAVMIPQDRLFFALLTVRFVLHRTVEQQIGDVWREKIQAHIESFLAGDANPLAARVSMGMPANWAAMGLWRAG